MSAITRPSALSSFVAFWAFPLIISRHAGTLDEFLSCKHKALMLNTPPPGVCWDQRGAVSLAYASGPGSISARKLLFLHRQADDAARLGLSR